MLRSRHGRGGQITRDLQCDRLAGADDEGLGETKSRGVALGIDRALAGHAGAVDQSINAGKVTGVTETFVEDREVLECYGVTGSGEVDAGEDYTGGPRGNSVSHGILVGERYFESTVTQHERCVAGESLGIGELYPVRG